MPTRPRVAAWAVAAAMALPSLAAAQASAASSVASPAASSAGGDPSTWRCATCPYDDAGASGQVEVGLATVTGHGVVRGDGHGLRAGGRLVVGGELRWRGADDAWARATARDLGLDARALQVEGGRGDVALALDHTQWPRRFDDGAMATPFVGRGGDTLTLPTGFPASTTDAMPLAGTLQAVAADLRRTRTAFGLRWRPDAQWSLQAELAQTRRDGSRLGSGSFFATASQFVAPVHETTDDVDVLLRGAAGPWTVQAGVRLSSFRSAPPALNWVSPFELGTLSAAAPLQGQLATAPDHRLAQVSAALGWQLSPSTRLAGEASWGRLTQDQALLPATTHAALGTVALPAASSNATVDLLHAALRLSTALGNVARLTVALSRDDRDDHTAQALWPGVAADLLRVAPRSNPATDLRVDRARVLLDLRGPRSAVQAAVGLDHDARERSDAAVAREHEDRLHGRLRLPLADGLAMTVQGLHAERKIDAVQAAPAVPPAENPRMRAFDQADRRRDRLAARVEWNATDGLGIVVHADRTDDVFPRTALGRQEARSAGGGLDVTWAPSAATSIGVFVRTDRVRTAQAGSSGFAAADWWAAQTDRVDALGLNLRHALIADVLDIGLEGSAMRARLRTAVDDGTLRDAFPAVDTSFDTLRVWAAWRISSHWEVGARLGHERMAGVDWAWDGLRPATLPNVLLLGGAPLRGQVTVLRLSTTLKF